MSNRAPHVVTNKPIPQTRLPLPSFLPPTGSFRARRSLPSSGEEGNCTYSRRRSDPAGHLRSRPWNRLGTNEQLQGNGFSTFSGHRFMLPADIDKTEKKVPTILTAPTFRLKTVCIGTTALHWRGASQWRWRPFSLSAFRVLTFTAFFPIFQLLAVGCSIH